MSRAGDLTANEVVRAAIISGSGCIPGKPSFGLKARYPVADKEFAGALPARGHRTIPGRNPMPGP
jgi:hypothetical protein